MSRQQNEILLPFTDSYQTFDELLPQHFYTLVHQDGSWRWVSGLRTRDDVRAY